MNKLFHSGYGLLTGLVLGIMLSVSVGVYAGRDDAAGLSALPVEDLQRFTDVYMRIKRNYVEEVDDSELLDNAIQGMLTGLDEHSSYLDEDDFRDMEAGTSGEFGGLGIEVGMEDGFVKVIAPIDDTPADRAGIQAGDLIVRLDGDSVRGMTLSDAVSRMRGEQGSDITLTVVRDGEDQPLEITITRDIIQVESVRSEMLEEGYGYVRVSNFQTRTARDLVSAIEELKEANGLKGLVLDLRNNPGGILNGAVGVSDAFLDGGRIVYTEGRLDEAQIEYDASPGDVLDGVPMVVLVNRGSASASEIVAGALQDHGRAIIMGQNSFGKGSVQTILPLSEQTGIKLTTARYFTPDGRSIQDEGINPDIALDERLRVSRSEDDEPARRDLPEDVEDEEEESLAERDFGLNEALNLLKGLNFYNGR
ncbi:carboxyl-terminal processing protease [Thioalkalivibrio sp. ALE21]|uniref:S41 family peptidase n=1 Tax=Thioalkalivibrio sp. ALE21 TaxID=1158175 RepID=UPI000D8D4C28|nr:S41 family peptidase [Thioalkalivibrio sp. ALE21]PYG03585.1 carboxyl-terminal processing protease [Thioalkalivibrio sp. ALE21]